jgi:PAS domain S-box-containing protein
MDDRWATPVPAGSGPCPIDPALATALRSHGRALGPATDGPAAAIGLDGAVLVLWGDDLRLDHDGEEWLGRLAASGRVHLARAAVADALAEEQATLRAVVDGTADGICVLDAAGVLRVWNPAMATLAGVAADAALDRPAHEVLGDGPWTVDGVHDVVRHGERVWRVSVAAVDEGALRVAVVHDVSAERRVARMKDDMLAVVSHELRTPLTPIKGSAQLLLRRWERLPDEQRERLLAQVVSSAEHLSRLVDDLLLVAQLSASSTSTPSVALVPTDLGTVVSDGVAAMRLGHPDHRIELVATAATSGLSDPLRVRQVLDNLVANACKFSPAGSAVRVALDVDGADAVLRVVDEGRGIPPEDIERVFERFERAEDPLVMTTSGAGLGLYIVRALVTALGGTIALRSTPGAGTTAIVRLPLLARPAGQREGSASSSLVSSSEASLSS